MTAPIESSDVLLPILGEVDVDAIYRNPNVRLYRKPPNGRKPMYENRDEKVLHHPAKCARRESGQAWRWQIFCWHSQGIGERVTALLVGRDDG